MQTAKEEIHKINCQIRKKTYSGKTLTFCSVNDGSFKFSLKATASAYVSMILNSGHSVDWRGASNAAFVVVAFLLAI